MNQKISFNDNFKETNQKIFGNVHSSLMLLNISSGKLTELQEFDHVIEAPLFRSADEIIFNSAGLIYSFSISRHNCHQINTSYCIRCNNDHVLSPDASKLAVSHYAEDQISRIYLIDLKKQAPPFLVTPLGPSYLHGWSPDGNTLVYCALRNGKYDIYSIPCCGGEETQLTDTLGKSDGPEFSSDGKYIYFNSVHENYMDCYRMNSDGSHTIRLTNNGRYNWFPHISPDNKHIVYLSFDPNEICVDDHPANKHVQIRAINPDCSNDRILIELFGGQGSINVNSWAPDSKHIAFVQYKSI